MAQCIRWRVSSAHIEIDGGFEKANSYTIVQIAVQGQIWPHLSLALLTTTLSYVPSIRDLWASAIVLQNREPKKTGLQDQV